MKYVNIIAFSSWTEQARFTEVVGPPSAPRMASSNREGRAVNVSQDLDPVVRRNLLSTFKWSLHKEKGLSLAVYF